MAKNGEFVLSATDAGNVERAMRRAGWTMADLQKFCNTTTSRHCLDLVRGNVTTLPVAGKLTVDLDRAPGNRGGRKHYPTTAFRRAVGVVDFQACEPLLAVTQQQIAPGGATGITVLDELKGKALLGVLAAEHFVAYPALIPESIRRAGRVLFLGDVFIDDRGKWHAIQLDVTGPWPQTFMIDLDSKWPEPVAYL